MDEKIIDIILEDIKELKQDVKDDFANVNEKIDKLLEFKFQLIGGSIVVSVIITAGFQVLSLLLKK
jgi:hypothetical protein